MKRAYVVMVVLLTACSGLISEPGPDAPLRPDQGGTGPVGPGPRGRPPAGAGGNGVDPTTLDQATLFSCDPRETTYTPSRVWRLTGSQVQNAASDVAGSSRVSAPSPFSSFAGANTFANYAESYSVAESQLNTLFRAGRAAAVWSLGDRAPGCVKAAARRLEDEAEPADPTAEGWFDESCRRQTVRWSFGELVRRPPTTAEEDRFESRMAELARRLGVRRGMTASITMMFAHPEFVFRSEIGVGDPVDGRVRLGAYELTAALTYALANRSPNQARVGDVAESGQILEPGVLAETARTLMADDSRHTFRAVMERFLNEYFHADVGAGIMKENNRDYRWGPAYQRLLRFVDWVVMEDTDFIRNLLTSTVWVTEDDEVRDDPSRPGILSQQAWLVSFSDNEENDPIARGHFIREQLLCQSIPEIPIGVIPQLPDDDGTTTLRERLSMHVSESSCAGCHNLMDPLGLPFEAFDHYGFMRDEEAGRPVDTSGEVIGSVTLDGPVANHRELVERLGSAQDVERCVIRHLFRFVMGRDETYGDACTLANAERAYSGSDGSLRATLESLVTSDTFQYRAAEGSTE